MRDTLSRALGALYGLAIGDALGMPTQSLARPAIEESFGTILEGFLPAAPDHPIAAGMVAGSITDDTEQALILAQLIVDGKGRVDGAEFARRLIAWEDDMRSRGSLDLLGPSTKAALAALMAGTDPAEAGRFGVTNGAAMRITPMGVAVRCDDLDGLIDEVVEVSAVTHNTGKALAGASAVAAAVSAGVGGASLSEAREIAIEAASRAGHKGYWVAGADVATRIRWAVKLVERHNQSDALDLTYRLIGTSVAVEESIPAAFALLAVAGEDPWLVARLCASVGGDCDTIAAIAGAIAGACGGVEAFPIEARMLVSKVNHLNLEATATTLVELRNGAAATPRAGESTQREPADGAAALAAVGSLLHLGNAVVDVVLAVPRRPTRGGDMLAGHTELVAGGGLNGMVAAARRGVKVRYGGAHGSGPFARLVREALAADGIEVLQVPRPGIDTGFVVTLVEPDGERTFVTSPGAEATLGEADLSRIGVSDVDAVYISGYGLAYERNRPVLLGFLKALSDAVLVVFDPGPLVAELSADTLASVLKRTDWLTCNEREARILTGADSPFVAAGLLAERVARKGVVVRSGGTGCHVCTKQGSPETVAGFRVSTLDTNGAGDTHAGVFTAELLKGASPIEAARLANAAAAISVTRRGPATAPTTLELDAFLARHDGAS